MPCSALPRGGRVGLAFPASPPALFTPANALAHVPPFNDVTDNNPCGKQTVASVNGVNVRLQNLCRLTGRWRTGRRQFRASSSRERDLRHRPHRGPGRRSSFTAPTALAHVSWPTSGSRSPRSSGASRCPTTSRCTTAYLRACSSRAASRVPTR